jgi:light-regulated signal transduction histidine kinase (bacteriophytochrome)
MEHFKIVDPSENLEHSNMPAACSACFATATLGLSINESNTCGKRKRLLEMNGDKLFYYCSGEEECLGSNKVFRSKVNVIKAFIPLFTSYKLQVAQELNRQNKRIFHNIITLNGHNIQELYALVSERTLSQKVDQQRTIIKDAIERNIDDSVSMFLRIAKNNLAIQTNFNVFNKLSEPKPVMSYRKHNVRRVLLTVFHVFFQDFFDKNIRVTIEDSDIEILLDFESTSVAFYHILDNAAKYSLKGSRINIKFVDNEKACLVMFEMDSIEIKEEEKYKLTEEGFKGDAAKRMESEGNGIGMFIINQLLKLTQSKLIVNPKIHNTRQLYDGIPYYRNQFIIELSKLNKK